MVVVTGATGLIGSFLVNELLKQGHQVRAISRRSFSSQNPTVLTWLQGDLLDPVFLTEAKMVSVSRGCKVLKSIKSASISGFCANVSKAQ